MPEASDARKMTDDSNEGKEGVIVVTGSESVSSSDGALHVTDSRTGRSYDIPISSGAVRATDLRQIKTSDDDYGVLSYDPAFLNTASCHSAITFIDGDRGILRYRGYPIEELAERCTFLHVAYLLLHGELPTAEQEQSWTEEITHHTFVHENIKKFIDGFHHDAHPMGILVSTMGALSTFYPDAKAIFDTGKRDKQVERLIAKMPTLAAFAYRHAVGLPYAYPDNQLSYAGNFLSMMATTTELSYRPHPVLEHIAGVKGGELRLMGFGHRVYKNFDPRASIIKTVADEVFKVTGRNPLLDIALELERIALADDYFVDHKLYPNVDFYSGIIYQAMGFPVEMFPVLFAIGRTPGWLAQWVEGILDSEQRISRPRQLYDGAGLRHVSS